MRRALSSHAKRDVHLVRALACVLAGLCVLTVAPRGAAAQERRIRAIQILGNNATNDETVMSLAKIDTGQPFNDARLLEIENALISSELFKDVSVQAIPEGDGVRLIINLADKHPWVIAPTVYLQPGNQGGGVGFGHNNLFARNKKLLVYGQIATADSMFILGYLDPSVGGSRLYGQMDVFLRREIVTEYGPRSRDFGEEQPVRDSTMLYLNSGFKLGINLFANLRMDARIRGAKVSFEDPGMPKNVAPSEVHLLPGDPPRPPGSDGYDISLEGRVAYDKSASYYGVINRTLVQVGYDRGMAELGSDFDYWAVGGKVVLARRLFQEHNATLKTSAMYGKRLPFQQEATSGGVDLRGFVNRQFRGDRQAKLTVEYSVPLFKAGSLAFRGLGFSDNSVTYFAEDRSDPANATQLVGDETVRNYVRSHGNDPFDQMANGVGGGFRIYMRSIVMPLLGIDVGYGLQNGDVHLYFAVGLTEL